VDERLEREVAIKAVPREGLQAWRRVEREARAAARLGHPGIVALYELGADAERAYLVSEYVPGRTLAELLAADAISDRDVARVGEAMCDALAHAHARGVVHRDVKPQNIMVAAEPAAGAGFAKLADFGASRLAAEDALTRTGDVVGTLAYMAPEQAEGLAGTGASDLYSLALTLYEALTGHNPVRAPGLAETARRVGRPLPPLRRLRPDLPAALAGAIDRALSPEPERRGTLADLHAGLVAPGTALSAAGGLAEPETLERFGLARRPRRSWLELLAGALAGASRDRCPRPGAAPPLATPEAGPRRGAALLARLGAAAAAAALAAAAVALLDVGGPSLDAALLAAAVGLAVLVLPRVGWLAAATVLVLWLLLDAPDRAGVAVLLALAAASVALLLPRAGALWSLPGAAAALGAAGLGPAFPALCGLAPGALRRAGLAAAGYVWLALAEALSGERLLFGSPEGTAASGTWVGSAVGAARGALAPLLGGPALLPALVWAAFAAALGFMVRGRHPGRDLLLGATWGAMLVLTQHELGRELAHVGLSSQPRGAVVGVCAGVLGVVAGASLWRRMARE
jgi:hypothetical protein